MQRGLRVLHPLGRASRKVLHQSGDISLEAGRGGRRGEVGRASPGGARCGGVLGIAKRGGEGGGDHLFCRNRKRSLHNGTKLFIFSACICCSDLGFFSISKY